MWTPFVTLFLFHFHRLLNSFAEEQAIEDAIYYLGEALRKDVIDLDVFLKVSMKMNYNVKYCIHSYFALLVFMFCPLASSNYIALSQITWLKTR